MPQTNLIFSNSDIICGRGKGHERFPGNKIFRQIIKEHAENFGNPVTKRAERSRMVNLIFNHLCEAGMRFLKQEKGIWVILHIRDAKWKIGHALRDAGVENYRRKKLLETTRRLFPHCRGRVYSALMVTDDEDDGDTKDHLSIEDGSTPQKIPTLDDMRKPSFPLTSPCSLSFAPSIITNNGGNDRNFVADTRSVNMTPGEFDVSITEIFLNFYDDHGDGVDDQVASINLFEWALAENSRINAILAEDVMK